MEQKNRWKDVKISEWEGISVAERTQIIEKNRSNISKHTFLLPCKSIILLTQQINTNQTILTLKQLKESKNKSYLGKWSESSSCFAWPRTDIM